MTHLIQRYVMHRLWWQPMLYQVETVDAKILSLARQDIIWQSVSKLVNDVDEKKYQH